MKFLIALLAVGLAKAAPSGGLPLLAETETLIQIFVNHQYLTGSKNGTVSGGQDKSLKGTYWRRSNENGKQILLRNAAYCYYLCINECGYYYTAKEPNSECLLGESFTDFAYTQMFKDHGKKKAYVALSQSGKIRRLMSKKLSNSKLLNASKMTIIRDTVEYTFECNKILKTKLKFVPVKTCVNPPKRMNHKNEAADDDYDDESVETVQNYYHFGEDEIHFNLLTTDPITTTTTESSKNSSLDRVIDKLINIDVVADLPSEHFVINNLVVNQMCKI
ncbi:fgf [Cryptophlebia peltastica nucleopolyhedrovirus]|uniref:Fgf n=1 Tax=Cryptophlebia peltastica nucleopolyhedrovirus TaxID=2304025 RepID=A0A346RNY4_9ABAC|nr:fgf [Cryptophlebia peltastica nucleopolyhedrovirus]AXS67781.1 fgf [Cryptophlebia peltastica nucleopolyhedrovirus]